MSSIIWKVKTFSELTTDELYAILKIRQEVFVVEQTCWYLDADGSDQLAIHLFAEDAAKIIAYLRIFPKGIKYKEASIGRVLSSSSARGKNFGKTLVGFGIEIILNQLGSKSIRISAQDYLIHFYESFGFTDTGKKYLEDDIPHTEMILQLSEIEELFRLS